MNSKQIAAVLLCAIFVTSSLYTSSALDCYDSSNCGLCSYCSRRNECPNGDGTQAAKDACVCSFQCGSGRGCNSPICSGRRKLLGEGSSDWSDLTPDMLF
ncbi:hypothetical protein COCSUDRAFT_54848 [Coccomyxa subellipsoidea C-169]|uniref:Uncharacterized protein n=1 Tax=Coccomyxa subellipsoidea (strain C-169) TaxID=574566 RepID=I0YJR1_COCSC|nr:hypothetical protein COCSUDRAFT_54848 [Coccomyxa subellipsoidea C-169]EIE18630.1 hypothetical protein COCSUDRAFT_54848 [Coccomyxa subellipsoidea C-169]|eukprot:XP_005643174.1 hypothetical protein COCSUDRAFT_54848 [Coccomyxa subellipsoidea C-169]